MTLFDLPEPRGRVRQVTLWAVSSAGPLEGFDVVVDLRAPGSPPLSGRGLYRLALPALQGGKKPVTASWNDVWDDDLGCYADHMEREEFRDSVEQLIKLARRRKVALVGGEASWFRCHRGLVADYLTARGHRVVHLGEDGSTRVHDYTPGARESARTGGHYARAVLGLEEVDDGLRS